MSTIAKSLAPADPAPDAGAISYAQFHHNNLMTTRLAEMCDWYGTVLGMTVTFEYPMGAWLTNDRANHRLALTMVPGLSEDPDQRVHSRLHHHAFEFESFADLNATYVRLAQAGIHPRMCLDHGMSFSYYYSDPDGHYVELQSDNFGDWDESSEWMRTSEAFKANPIGAFVDPEKVAAACAEGASFADIRERVWSTDDFRPAEFPDMMAPPRPADAPPLPVKW
jgi:catechol 2,3-dioxygenase